MLLMSSAIQVN